VIGYERYPLIRSFCYSDFWRRPDRAVSCDLSSLPRDSEIKTLPARTAYDSLVRAVARQFKPLRFFVMMAVAAFVVCGVTAFYTHRGAHGRTPEERAAYVIGKRAGEDSPVGAKLPMPADLNMMAQKYFRQQGSGNQQNWDLAFEDGYEDGFKKTHSQ
jgi:hypothetical protein